MLGKSIGNYSIIEKIGEGGMGVVYRAEDSKLGREVAIKALPRHFLLDEERLKRFNREARVLASMNHTNIAAIYGIEEIEDQQLLILEYVPGDTLAKQIKSNRLSIQDALEIFQQIAKGLEAAHEQGVIHRDLKPANIIIRPRGDVKILDFGLAKSFQSDESEIHEQDDSTILHSLTDEGVLFGTTAYMSPEQARGKHVDRRTDIWAFGCVLFEALSGKKIFTRGSVPEVVAAIISEDPDWDELPANLPPRLIDLIKRCLRKDPNTRLRDIGDARIELDEIRQAYISSDQEALGLVTTISIPKSTYQLPWMLLVLMVVVSTILAFKVVGNRSGSTLPVLTSVIPIEQGVVQESFSQPNLAISPDGRYLVFDAELDGEIHLFLHDLLSMSARAIDGTAGAIAPFFSPDGEWIGFFSEGQMRKIQPIGGTSVHICSVPVTGDTRGASWGTNGNIVYTPSSGSGLWIVDESGGPPELLIRPDPAQDERSFRWPDILPGNRGIIYTISPPDIISFDDGQIAIYSYKSQESKILLKGMCARYISTGHLVFSQSGTLFAIPFDLNKLEISGQAVPVVDDLLTYSVTGAAQYTCSSNGTLVYSSGGAWQNPRTALWVDHRGTTQPLSETMRPYNRLSLAPNGRQYATELMGACNEIWIGELAGGPLRRLTFGWENRWPVWSPDNQMIAFASSRQGVQNLYWKDADGAGPTTQLTRNEFVQVPTSWHPQDQVLLFHQIVPDQQRDIWVLRIDNDKQTESFVETQYDEYDAQFSPHGKYVAYTSNETNEYEVYVQSFPPSGGKTRISENGGHTPLWSSDGTTLYYRNGEKLLATTVDIGPVFQSSNTRELFETDFEEYHSGMDRPGFMDIAPSGDKFIMMRQEPSFVGESFRVIVNWFNVLKQIQPDR